MTLAVRTMYTATQRAGKVVTGDMYFGVNV